jgi:hypothetical protein
MGTMWNGMFIYAVEPGTVIDDPNGKKPSVTVDGETCAVVGRKLYCTKDTEEKLIARIERMRAADDRPS